MRDKITIARLHEVLICCPDTGRLFHKIDRGGYKAGAEAFLTRHKRGYRVGRIDKVDLLRHRVVWAMANKAWPEGGLDHRDNTPGNDWLDNLRPATATQNQGNRGARYDSATGVKGVERRGNSFRAKLMFERRQYNSPAFATVEEAKAWYDAKAKELFGEFFRA